MSLSDKRFIDGDDYTQYSYYEKDVREAVLKLKEGIKRMWGSEYDGTCCCGNCSEGLTCEYPELEEVINKIFGEELSKEDKA